MKRIARFEKVSYKQFKKDFIKTFGDDIPEEIVRGYYDAIELPKRATSCSAGYDFYSPVDVDIEPGCNIAIPTGIRCSMYNNWVLMAFPRSGHGFKYGVHLANTVGVIDADYYNSDNEGHIFIKLVNDSSIAKMLSIDVGDAFCQGVFLSYGVTEDDDVDVVRNGGFGSTDAK